MGKNNYKNIFYDFFSEDALLMLKKSSINI
jgi:hypothetical protein